MGKKISEAHLHRCIFDILTYVHYFKKTVSGYTAYRLHTSCKKKQIVQVFMVLCPSSHHSNDSFCFS